MVHSGVADGRRTGFDYLRGFVIVIVVLHHAVLGYCAFGHFDPAHHLWSTAPIVDSQPRPRPPPVATLRRAATRALLHPVRP